MLPNYTHTSPHSVSRLVAITQTSSKISLDRKSLFISRNVTIGTRDILV